MICFEGGVSHNMITRLHQITGDCGTYASSFRQLLSEGHFGTVGKPVNIADIHSKVVQPYIEVICRNIDKRFGDAAGNISIAATIFEPHNVDKMFPEEQMQKIRILAKYFEMDENEAVSEWSCFRNYLKKHEMRVVQKF